MKYYFVSWETGMEDKEDPLDDCALQGPHTRDKAIEMATAMRKRGLKASVIDCSDMFKSLIKSEYGGEVIEIEDNEPLDDEYFSTYR